jgi:hypothetical protein
LRPGVYLPLFAKSRNSHCGLALILGFFEGLAFVILFLTLGYRDLDLGSAVFEVERQWDERDSGLSNLARKSINFNAVQEKFALAAG